MDLVFRSPKSSWVLEQTSKARCSPLIWAPTIWTPAIWTRVEQELKWREIEEGGVRGGEVATMWKAYLGFIWIGV